MLPGPFLPVLGQSGGILVVHRNGLAVKGVTHKHTHTHTPKHLGSVHFLGRGGWGCHIWGFFTMGMGVCVGGGVIKFCHRNPQKMHILTLYYNI